MSNKIVKFTDLLDCPKTLVSNDVVVVNADASGLDVVTPSSLIISGVGSGLNGDIATFTGGIPVLQDSNINITATTIKPTSNSDVLTLESNSVGGMNINFPNGQLNLNGISQHSVLYGDFSLSANNGGTINGAGGQSMVISPSGVDITTQTGCSLRLFVNGMTLQFQPGSTGNYYWPLTDGTAGQVLTTDGNGVLYWSGGGP